MKEMGISVFAMTKPEGLIGQAAVSYTHLRHHHGLRSRDRVRPRHAHRSRRARSQELLLVMTYILFSYFTRQGKHLRDAVIDRSFL